MKSEKFSSRNFLRFLGREIVSKNEMKEFMKKVNENEEFSPDIFSQKIEDYPEQLQTPIKKTLEYNSPLSIQVNILILKKIVDFENNSKY